MALRMAYIGAGAFTNAFMYPHITRHGVELAAVCDLDLEKAELARGRCGFRKVYTDFRLMLAEEKPDAVICIGGPKVHYEVGMEVLDAKVPLYVQKPPALTSAQTREMADLAKKRGVVCHVGFNMRSAPAVRQAKRIVATPEFGNPLMGIFRYGLASTPDLTYNVFDQHIHIIDLARYLMGDFKSLDVTFSTRPEARDYIISVLFESGAVGSVNLTSGQPFEKEFMYYEITGNGSVLQSHSGGSLKWQRSQPGAWFHDPQPDHVWSHGEYGLQVPHEVFGYLGDISNFLRTVEGVEQDHSPISDSIITMELCEEVVRQIHSRNEAVPTAGTAR